MTSNYIAITVLLLLFSLELHSSAPLVEAKQEPEVENRTFVNSSRFTSTTTFNNQTRGGLISQALDAISGAFSFMNPNQDLSVTNQTQTIPAKKTNSSKPASRPEASASKNSTSPAKIEPATGTSKKNGTSTSTITNNRTEPRKPTETEVIVHIEPDSFGATKNGTNKDDRKIRDLLDLVLTSLYTFGKLALPSSPSRSARTANESMPQESSKLVLVNPQLDQLQLNSDNVHLLCKLLHDTVKDRAANRTEHPEDHQASTAIAITSSTPNPNPFTTTTTNSPTTSSRPGRKFTTTGASQSSTTTMRPPDERASALAIVRNPKEVSASTHFDWLMESSIRCDLDVRPIECQDRAQRMMISLFRLGLSRMRLQTTAQPRTRSRRNHETTSAEMDDSEIPDLASKQVQVSGHHANGSATGNEELILVSCCWLEPVDRPNQVTVQYWLMKRMSAEMDENDDSQKFVWRVLTFEEASEILGMLSKSEIERYMKRSKLHFHHYLMESKLRLDRPRKEFKPRDNLEPDEQEAKLPDETLNAGESTSGLAYFWHNLTSSSLTDNLFLYLILISLIVFVIAICISVSMLCSPSRSSHVRDRPDSSSMVKSMQQQEARKLPDNETIWRKLSNTTTTLVQDDMESIRIREARVRTTELRTDQLLDDETTKRKSPFSDWITLERDERFVEEREKRRTGNGGGTRKSGQTTNRTSGASPRNILAQIDDELVLDDSTRQARDSSTLTKSELVMLKEKLIPIGQQQQQHHNQPKRTSRRQVASQTSDPMNMDSELEMDMALGRTEPDYLNQSVYLEQKRQNAAAAGSNSGTARRRANEDRAASFFPGNINSQGLIQYPAKTSEQIAAIKSELARLEQQDRLNQSRDV